MLDFHVALDILLTFEPLTTAVAFDIIGFRLHSHLFHCWCDNKKTTILQLN